jgi:hypothetical protein
MDTVLWSHGWMLRGEPKPIKPFSAFEDPGGWRTKNRLPLESRNCEFWNFERQNVVTGTFRHFGVWVFKGPRVRRHGVPSNKITKPWNTKRRHAQVFSRPVPEDEGTYGFIQRVPAGARRAISAQGRERSKDQEVAEPYWSRGGIASLLDLVMD